MRPILELSAVSKTYGRAHELTTVLHDVNLTVAEGDFVSIIGYSGPNNLLVALVSETAAQPWLRMNAWGSLAIVSNNSMSPRSRASLIAWVRRS